MSLYKRSQSDTILLSTYSIAVVSDHIQGEVVNFFVNVTQQRKMIWNEIQCSEKWNWLSNNVTSMCFFYL